MSDHIKKAQDKENAAVEKRHHLLLTSKCNNNCIFCLAADEMRADSVHRTFKEIKKDMKQGFADGAVRLILSGGEASIHPQFLDIIKTAKEMGYKKVQHVTNGRMYSYGDFFNKAIAAGLDEITFSMHGDNSKLHDAQVGVKGAFSQSLRGLTNALRSKKVIVNIDIVINKFNFKHLARIIRFFRERGVYEFDLLQFVPFGNAWENRQQVFYELDNKTLKYLARAFKYSREEGMFIWTNRFPVAYLEGNEELIQHPYKLNDEIAGRLDGFSNFIKEDEMFECYGKRCQWCFIKDFCRDLRELKKKGEIKVFTVPKCLGGKIINVDSENVYKFSGRKNFDIFDFLNNFYIDHRYYVKSLRCEKCRYNQKCKGANINLIRQKGFKVLKPIQ